MKLNNKEKFCFVGLSIGSDSSNESGIAVIDRDLNLIRCDKAYQLSELKQIVTNFSRFAPSQNVIICADLPKNIMMLQGKWRIESKNNQILTMNASDGQEKKSVWKKRYSDRGAEMCSSFKEEGMDVFRYNSYFSINMLKLTPPYKIRMPAGCKFLQLIIEEKLGITGIPSNLLPLPVLLSLVGAYTAWKIANSEENEGYKHLGAYKKIEIVSALNI